jgi:hypothetical protein
MNKKTVSILGLLLVTSALSGCAVVDRMQAINAEADQRARESDGQRVTAYFNKLNPAQAKMTRVERGVDKPPVVSRPVQISIQDALAKYVPKEYKVTTAPDVDVKTIIVYDSSTPWIEALGKSFSSVGIEMDANMYKKLMFIRAFQTTLLEIVDKYIPADYEVFIDSAIDADTQLPYDTSQHWMEALSKGAAHAGIDVTANITKKIVLIKPLVSSNVGSVTKSVVTPMASKGKERDPILSPN